MKSISFEEIKEKPFLSRKETAFYLGVHVNTLDRAGLPCTKVGRRKLYSRILLDQWLESNSKGGNQ